VHVDVFPVDFDKIKDDIAAWDHLFGSPRFVDNRKKSILVLRVWCRSVDKMRISLLALRVPLGIDEHDKLKRNR
jgi:hypothetical protein